MQQSKVQHGSKSWRGMALREGGCGSLPAPSLAAHPGHCTCGVFSSARVGRTSFSPWTPSAGRQYVCSWPLAHAASTSTSPCTWCPPVCAELGAGRAARRLPPTEHPLGGLAASTVCLSHASPLRILKRLSKNGIRNCIRDFHGGGRAIFPKLCSDTLK